MPALRWRVLIVVLFVALGCSLAVRASSAAHAAIAGLPVAPTVSYAPAGTAPHIDLDAAIRKVGLDAVDSYTAWRLFERQVTTGLERDEVNLSQMRASIHLATGEARYVLLTDTSPVQPIGPVTALSPLYRQPVWLIPTYSAAGTIPPGRRDFLVLDGRTDRLLEHLTIVPIDPFDTCAGMPMGLGHIRCLLQHIGDARAMAYRSVP